MSVREINDKFHGLRVQRIVNGVPHSKHYSFRIPVFTDGTTTWRAATRAEKKELTILAEAYDQELQQKQESEKRFRKFDPFGSNTNTGIKGISYRIGVDSQQYEVEAFWLNLSVDGKQHSSSVRLASRTWEEGWKLIVDKLVKVKELTPSTRRKIMSMIPSERKLRAKR